MINIYLMGCIALAGCLYAERVSFSFDGRVRGLEERSLELMRLFLPADPIVVISGISRSSEISSILKEWPCGEIICFEPNPFSCSAISTLTVDNKNVGTVEVALYNHIGTASLYISQNNYRDDPTFGYRSSLLQPSKHMQPYYKGPVTEVSCTTLDTWCEENQLDHIDLLRLDLQGGELQALEASVEILSTVKIVSVKTNFFPFRIGMTRYEELKSFLEQSGFELLVHWYRRGIEGNAIFIKKEKDLLWEGDKYQKYYIPDLHAYLYLDEVPDHVKQQLRRGVYWESNIGGLIGKWVQEGSVAVDIGAHIGIHTITMSRKAGKTGMVVAFEPQKKLIVELLQNLRLNNCYNVIPIRKALGSKQGMVEMRPSNPYNEGKSCIGSGGDEVEATTLDSFQLKNVSLIKVNVEGDEFFTFQGAKETILKNRPILIFEVMGGYDYNSSSEEIKEKFEDVISLVESFEYDVQLIFGNDYIAFPKEGMRSD